MGSFKKAPPEDMGVTAQDVIFSCQVCSATFSEVYEGNHDTVHGLSDGINPKDRIVTKLFVTSCCHVVCTEHLEGGGAPFHPSGKRPRASCPVCIKEKGNSEPRDLFSIRGFERGQYDTSIPEKWFMAPPLSLDGNNKEMEALRFQYLALVAYGRNAAASHRESRRVLSNTEEELKNVRSLASEQHAKAAALEKEVQRLRVVELELEQLRAVQPVLQKYKERQPQITHYLSLIPKLVEQNRAMDKRLASLGFRMPLEPLTYSKVPFPWDKDGNLIDDSSANLDLALQKTASSHTASRSIHTSGHAAETTIPSPQTFRPLKRQRIESPLPNDFHETSQDKMPPPSKPLSRMKSMKKILPSSIRKKFSSGRAAPLTNSNYSVGSDVQMFDSGHWDDADSFAQPNSDCNQPCTRHGSKQGTPYMSGALPAEGQPPAAKSPDSQLLPSLVGIPTEPSYIRIMDRLSHDDVMDLGLQDPRQPQSHQYYSNQGTQSMNVQQNEDRQYDNEECRHWNIDHAFLDKETHGGASSAAPYNEATMDPITPAPRRFQQPTPRVESVVSPFFKSSNRNPQGSSQTGVAELEDSFIHSDAYRYPRERVLEHQEDWREPRSLNGLSFFSSPLNTRNEPIGYRKARRPSQYMERPLYQARNLDSHGFITRPDTGRLPFLIDGAYGSFNRSPSFRQGHLHPQSAIPFPSLGRRPQSRVARLPSAMPSIVSARSPRRSKLQRNNLEHAGVRSSRHTQRHLPSNTLTNPLRNLFSSAGRRSVRR